MPPSGVRVVYSPQQPLTRQPAIYFSRRQQPYEYNFQPAFANNSVLTNNKRIISVVGTGAMAYLAAIAIKRTMPNAVVYMYYQGDGDATALWLLNTQSQRILSDWGIPLDTIVPRCWLEDDTKMGPCLDSLSRPSPAPVIIPTISTSTAATMPSIVSVSPVIAGPAGSRAGGAAGTRVVSEPALTKAVVPIAFRVGVQVLDRYTVGPKELDILAQYNDIVLTAPPVTSNARQWMSGPPWNVQFENVPIMYLRGTVMSKTKTPEIARVGSAPRDRVFTPVSQKDVMEIKTPIPAAPTDVYNVVVMRPSSSGPSDNQPWVIPPEHLRSFAAGELKSHVGYSLYTMFVTDAAKLFSLTGDGLTVNSLTVVWNRGLIVNKLALRDNRAQVLLLGSAAVDWPTELSNVPNSALNMLVVAVKGMASNTPTSELDTLLKAERPLVVS